MILVDTSVWVDHLRAGDAQLAERLDNGQILTHPAVIGELALGDLRRRTDLLDLFAHLPVADVATDAEVLVFIAERALSGSGIGYVDAHLLAATVLTHGASLWTRDRRLLVAAERLGLAMSGPDAFGVHEPADARFASA